MYIYMCSFPFFFFVSVVPHFVKARHLFFLFFFQSLHFLQKAQGEQGMRHPDEMLMATL